MKTSLLFFISLISFCSFSQTKISGIVKDELGYEVSYATIAFLDKSAFTNADAEGRYTISCKSCSSDTLIFTSLGYKPFKTTYKKGTDQRINVTLVEDVIELEEVIIESVENPAFAIMRKVIDNKPKNDTRALDAYQYESYNKVELDVNNITEGFLQEKVLKKLNTSIQELDKLVDDHGRRFFPVFISESISDFHYTSKPEARKETVKATRIKGLGVMDGSFTSQLIGATFVQFNFYKNSMEFLEKEFISPITTGWRVYYKYELVDSLMVNDRFSYELNIQPKNSNAAAFVGKIWIDKETYALTKIDLTIPRSANINYIKSIEITREWIPTEAGPFFPRRTDFVIDAENLTKKSVGAMIKSTFTIDSLIVNQPKESSFYKYPLQVNEDAQSFDNSYWEANRHDSLSLHEQDAFALVDTIKNLPIVRSYLDIFDIVFNGYLKVGKISVGPYLTAYAYNELEEHRLRIGGKTNPDFSKKAFFKGYLAYGTGDKKWKHQIHGRFILSRYPYTETGFNWQNDFNQLGIDQASVNAAFNALSRWGSVVAPYYGDTKEFFFSNQLNRHFSTKLTVRHKSIKPAFEFEYFKDITRNETSSTINTSEIELNTQFAFNERFLQTDYGRQSLGSKKPTFSLAYTLGIKDALESDFEYHKLVLGMNYKFGLGVLGQSKIYVRTGKVFGTLPYPLLNVHLGNQSAVYIYNAFNMMNYSEFVTDQFIDIKWIQHFQGLLFDRIPIFKKLKLREVVNVAALWGSVNQKNFDVLTPKSQVFGTFGDTPYLEVGYGIENIFKFMRLEVFQRLTYLNRPNVNQFGAKIGFQLML